MYICRICQEDCDHIYEEEHAGYNYNIFRCRNCKTIQVAEHNEEVSPDYTNLTDDDITHFHIWMGREHKKSAYQQFNKIIQSIIKKDSIQLIDIGCGTGGFIEYLSKNNKKIDARGFDASKAQVNYANQNKLNVAHANNIGDYLKISPADSKAIDIVTLWDVLEHIRTPNIILNEIKNLLSKDGVIYISVPSAGAQSWKMTLYKLLRKKYSFDPWEHVFYYDLKSIKILLENNGYQIVKQGTVSCYNREKSISEYLRRFITALLSLTPNLHPQIWIIAKVRNA